MHSAPHPDSSIHVPWDGCIPHLSPRALRLLQRMSKAPQRRVHLLGGETTSRLPQAEQTALHGDSSIPGTRSGRENR